MMPFAIQVAHFQLVTLAQFKLVTYNAHEMRVLLASPNRLSLRPSLSGTTTTPSADFCTAVREPHCPLSSLSGNTVQTSRGKTASLHRAPAGFTALALDGYGLRDLMLTRPASSAS